MYITLFTSVLKTCPLGAVGWIVSVAFNFYMHLFVVVVVGGGGGGGGGQSSMKVIQAYTH